MWIKAGRRPTADGPSFGPVCGRWTTVRRQRAKVRSHSRTACAPALACPMCAHSDGCVRLSYGYSLLPQRRRPLPQPPSLVKHSWRRKVCFRSNSAALPRTLSAAAHGPPIRPRRLLHTRLLSACWPPQMAPPRRAARTGVRVKQALAAAHMAAAPAPPLALLAGIISQGGSERDPSHMRLRATMRS